VIKRLGTAAVVLLLLAALAPAAAAGQPFAGETSTAGGYSTWDSDLINIERVPQTGRGVYVAVLAIAFG